MSVHYEVFDAKYTSVGYQDTRDLHQYVDDLDDGKKEEVLVLSANEAVVITGSLDELMQLADKIHTVVRAAWLKEKKREARKAARQAAKVKPAENA